MTLCVKLREFKKEALPPVKLTWVFIFVSLLSIFDNYGKLYGIDGYMLEASYWLKGKFEHSQSVQYKSPGLIKKSDGIIVLTISQEMYVKDFHGQSPLDRGVLADLIHKISSKNPDSMYFDIDMSPTSNLSDKDIRLIQTFEAVPNNQHLSLSLSSIGEQSKKQRKIKADWIEDRCSQSNLNIARPTLLESNGKVMRYYSNLGSLGIGENQLGVCNNFDKETYQSLATPLVSSYIKFPTTGLELEKDKINFKDKDSISVIKLNSIQDIDLLPNLDNKSVFIGLEGFKAQNGISDEFLTPIGILPGVLVHAFQNLTQSNPIKSVSGTIELLVDLLIVIFVIWIGNLNSVKRKTISFLVFGVGLLLLFPVAMSYGFWIPPFIILVGVVIDFMLWVKEKLFKKLSKGVNNEYTWAELKNHPLRLLPIFAAISLFIFDIQSEFDTLNEMIAAVPLFVGIGAVFIIQGLLCPTK